MMIDETTESSLAAISSSLQPAVVDLPVLKERIIALLAHLVSPNGRSAANCQAVDMFFCLDNRWPKRALPKDFQDLLTDMGGTLHDAVAHPEIAKNFDSTPDQLLARAKN